MAKRRSTKRSQTGGGYSPKRDWSKIVFYAFSVLIVLSMIVSSFAFVFTGGGF